MPRNITERLLQDLDALEAATAVVRSAQQNECSAFAKLAEAAKKLTDTIEEPGRTIGAIVRGVQNLSSELILTR